MQRSICLCITAADASAGASSKKKFDDLQAVGTSHEAGPSHSELQWILAAPL
eukprot:CAMPEP_0169165098 /NCGR_PEP_ID=MMETSP1015-20121227/59228_1 /TAXON_ID=342587 /ORGANISM="Karlodinium micrum, Strain CCMP2283" /LENGTH=51 /DNA_ID=CAMNT_0009237661 /DNA_START=434 /DNA_END=589 /DNA_ORIENTATION=+